ncbi:TetR/AcrR family transcriptional regulator [Haliangium ochraceum]|nr:TetR/AcrR family transcriptional regulator [Haliangium ochraceum]
MRTRLAEVALRIVDSEGPDACSLRRVAADAGISRTTPYTYFASKDELLDAVRSAALHALSDACEAALAEAGTVAERLAAVGHAYVQFALARPHLYDLIFAAHAGGPEHERAIERYRRLAESPLREAFAQGLVTLAPTRLAHVLWSATHGLITLHRAGTLQHGVSFEQLRQDVGDILAFGFVPREEQSG